MPQLEKMRFELIMDAGNGAQKAGDILIKAFAKTGRYVFIEPLIPAEISPPKRTPHSMSGVVIRLSKSELSNIGSVSELMLVEHEILLSRRLQDKDYGDGAVVLLDMGNEKRAKDAYQEAIDTAASCGLTVIPFHMSEEAVAHIKTLHGNGKNMFYLGLLSAVFGVDKDVVRDLIKSTFKKLKPEILDVNLQIFDLGIHGFLDLSIEQYEVPTHVAQEDAILLDGNTALSLGVIDSGIRFYSGYPITPASSIMHNLAKLLPSYGGVLHQAEDEISAIGAAIGSYYGGVPSITATSGPGLSLKQEFLGLSVVSEIPCIVVDVQRGGPSTGLPTRTEQTDLFACIFGSHGDSPKVVFSVSNVEDCFYAPHLARYITETLKLPVIILSDYMTSVSYRVLASLQLAQMTDVSDIPQFILDRFFMGYLPDDIEMVKDSQTIPGEVGGERRITGLNTDAGGNVMYSSDSNQRSHAIRNNKVNAFKKVLKTPEIMGEPSGDVLIIGWGSSRGVLQESVTKAQAHGLSVSAMHIKMVYPLPLGLADIFKQFKKVVTVEVAYADEYKPTPFAMMLRSETLCDVECAIAQATGRPLKPHDVVAKIQSLTKEVA